jgi:hypothetical protein
MFPTVFHLLRLKLDPCYDKQLSYWKSTTIPCAVRGGLNFSAPSGERQKHICAFNGALATGFGALGLYGKK